MLVSVVFLAIALQQTLAATCGGSEYFEYKFTPKKVGPINPKEVDDAQGRCGTGENHCEVVVQVYGNDKCKVGQSGKQMKGPGDKNLVQGSDMTPPFVDWTTHSLENLSNAKKLPFKVQVCDEDSFFRGGNDQILKYEFQDLTEGCKDHKFEEGTAKQKHPWFIEFELCCRKITHGAPAGGRFSSSGGRNHGTGSRRRTQHSPKFEDIRNRFESSTGRPRHRYNLRHTTQGSRNSWW